MLVIMMMVLVSMKSQRIHLDKMIDYWEENKRNTEGHFVLHQDNVAGKEN